MLATGRVGADEKVILAIIRQVFTLLFLGDFFAFQIAHLGLGNEFDDFCTLVVFRAVCLAIHPTGQGRRRVSGGN